ncbi:pre-rRNA-processing protein TSR1 homolog [Olea europaea var. sylvestris]|uniref:pre-rRNA-processing protein TSR1 homolog n=1 Tax=Olea europaea var. sylvestris TaxID=158386 RepID=UPI000C1CF3F9|nr:pre-rRNA-processing protein TSR1 homolog [Olea europaea var. sylvestris]
MLGSLLQVNKPHKTRFASKSSRNIHKISQKDKSKISKSERNVAKGAKAARLERNKLMREQKRAAVLKEKRASSGTKSPPRVIISAFCSLTMTNVLFGLSASVNLDAIEEDILALLSGEGNNTVFPAVASVEYKLRATVLKAPHGDLLACMEMAKVADLIGFIASPTSLHEDGNGHFIDSFRSQCLSLFRTLGLPSTVVLIRDLPNDIKKKNNLKKMCTSSIASEFPENCEFYPADTKDELHKFMQHFKEQRITVPHWQNQRPYLMSHKVDIVADECNSGKCTLLLTGYIRAHGLSVNQLVHVAGAGDFQLSKIELLRDPCPVNARKGEDYMESDDTNVQVMHCFTPVPLKQESLLVENAPDPLVGEQTWPTEAEMAEADQNHQERKQKKKKLSWGTSDYQAAWIVDDSDADEVYINEDEDDGMVLDDVESVFPVQKHEDFELDDDQGSLFLRESDEETETDSIVMEGDNLTKEHIEEQIRKIKEEHAEDEEFPDEVDTPLDVPARKRFAKYRGVKSFRTSSWDPKESLPQEYARIFAFDNFTRTQKHVLARTLDMEQDANDCIPVGSYARIHIKEVPKGVASKLCMLAKKMPVISSGLLQHESKISVLHFSIRKHDTYDAPIKAKELLLFRVGFCQFLSRPIFSSDNINSDKHKMERFLHAGQFSVASIYTPISFPSLPLIALKSEGEDSIPTVAAVGSLKSIDPDRIILKKIILSGYPERVSKKKATVRYMFHNPEDVRWFKPIEVWTKCGRCGVMKCVFNGVLQQHDTVCLSLYKRTYPKWPRYWFPLPSAWLN